MDALNANEVSRRTMLKHAGVTAGISAVLALAMGSRPAAAAASTSVVPAAAGSIERYVSSTSVDGLTDLAGVHAEYRSAIQIFPFDLPEGVSFPPESSYRDTDPASAWERGNGVAEAYFFWHNATAAAAKVAYERGDATEAGRLLSTLEVGYSSSVRMAVWEDAAGTFSPALKQARSGDYQGLMQLSR